MTHLSSRHPLVRLLGYAPSPAACCWRVCSPCSTSSFDLAPPALIGAAVDIVVQRELVHRQPGLPNVYDQLLVLALITLVIWILESIFEYVHRILWRNLAQMIEHELRVEAYAHVQGLSWPTTDQSTGGLLSILNDDINQLERFLDVGPTI